MSYTYAHYIRRPLTNAHALSRCNYHIKVSLLIPNTVLIATLDNLLNCSIMRPVLLPPSSSSSSASLEAALRIQARSLPACDFVPAAGQIVRALCAHCLWKSPRNVAPMRFFPHILADDYYADDRAVLHTCALARWSHFGDHDTLDGVADQRLRIMGRPRGKKMRSYTRECRTNRKLYLGIAARVEFYRDEINPLINPRQRASQLPAE